MNIPIEIVVLVCSTVIGALGYVFQKMMSAFSKNTDAFNSINESIQDIRLWITKKDTADKYEEKECQAIHSSIHKKIENHEGRIKNLEDKI